MKSVYILILSYFAITAAVGQIQCKGTEKIKPSTYTIEMVGGDSKFTMNGKSVTLKNGGVQQSMIYGGKSYFKFSSLDYSRQAEIVEVNNIRFDSITLIDLATKNNDYVLLLNFGNAPNFADMVTCTIK